MQAERWKRIKEILDVSLRLPAEERPGYLNRICEGDQELREEVESLIEAHEQAGDLFDTPPVIESEDLPAGTRLGPYEIVEHVGEGGMGAVYRAVRADETFQKEVAIKLVKRGLDLERVVRHFRVERQIMASLEHPNIAMLLDGGATPDGVPYFVMEFIRGAPIDVYCDENGLDVRQRLNMFRTVCAAVEFAHQHGIVHRDIKPNNIIVTAGGVPKLLDFGIAKILNPDKVEGPRESPHTVGGVMTPDYASPEQLNGEPVSKASDVYSLGVVMWELLCGTRPYPPRTPFRHVSTEMERVHLPSRMAGRPDLAGDLDYIVLKTLAPDPAERYPSAGGLEDDIRRYLEYLPVTARPQGLPYRISKFVRRQRVAVTSVGVTLAAMAVIGVIFQIHRGLDSGGPPPEVVQLTSFRGEEFEPALSPDGSRVAYVWSGEAGNNQDVYIQPVNGHDLKRLTTDPDRDLSPAWSPDGSSIAWLRLRSQDAAIYVAPADGGLPRQFAAIFPDRVDVVGRQLDWSPDGAFIAVTDKASPGEQFRLMLINVKDGSRRDVTLPPGQTIGDMCPAFSPDGKRLAFLRALSSGIGDIYVTSIEGGAVRRVTFDNRYIVGFAWTPDGRSIVFSSERGGNAALWQVRVSGGSPKRVVLAGINVSDPAFSRDGRELAFTQFVNDANIWRLKTADPRGATQLIASTQYDSSPQYSPDGSRIVFRSNRSGTHEIWISDAEGRSVFQLTHFGGGLTGTPRWSRDGQQIAFDSRFEGQADIYVMPAAGGPHRRITTSPAEDVVPSWSIDGRWIYFASNRTGAWQVWRAPAGGGPEEQVTKLGAFAPLEAMDGKWLYYAKGRNAEGLWRKQLPNGIEEPVIEELKPGFWGYWAPAQKGLYFMNQPDAGSPPGLYFYETDTRRRRQLRILDKPVAIADSGFALSPDGRYILYAQMDQKASDILIMKNYKGPE